MNLNILFALDSNDYSINNASFIYRIENLAYTLSPNNINLVLFNGWSLIKIRKAVANSLNIIIIHRPKWSIELVLFIKLIKRLGWYVWADFDDLVFDPLYSEYSPAFLNNILSLKKVLARFRAHQRALDLVDGVFVSTAELKSYGEKLFISKPFIVIPNAIHFSWMSKTESKFTKVLNAENLLITYLSGTKSHNRDFKVFEQALGEFLYEHKNVILKITGPLLHFLKIHKKQIIHTPRVDFKLYSSEVKVGWVNLLPLESTPFNHCKSALKIIEASYWNVPTVSSFLPDAMRLIDRGAIVVYDPGEVYSKLTDLLNNEVYDCYCNNLRDRILQVADVKSIAAHLVSQLSKIYLK